MLRCLVESSHIPMIFPCSHSNYGPLTLRRLKGAFGQAISAMRNGRKLALATRTVTEEMSATSTPPETPEVTAGWFDAGRSLKKPR